MILPIVGHIGKQRYNVGGMSTPNGFKLVIYDLEKNSSISFNTKHFHNDVKLVKTKLGNAMCLLIAYLIGCFAILINLLSLGEPNLTTGYFLKYTWHVILIPGSLMFCIHYVTDWAYTLTKLSSCIELREWHSLEHRVVNLIESGQIPTIESIKACPSIVINCSVAIEAVYAQLFLTNLIIPFFLQKIGISSFFGFSFNIMFIISIYLFFIYMVSIGTTGYKRFFYFLISFPLLVIPLLIERIFSLSTPPDWKIKQVATELRAFLIMNNINRP